MALIGKSAQKRHLCDRMLIRAKKALGEFDPPLHPPDARRFAGRELEGSREVAGRKITAAGDLGQCRRTLQAFEQAVLRLSQLRRPKRSSHARGRHTHLAIGDCGMRQQGEEQMVEDQIIDFVACSDGAWAMLA